MRMMTIPECVEALGGRVTDQQLRYGIRMGYYKGLRIGSKLFVDLDTVRADLPRYEPRKSYPGGLVSREELARQTGLSRRQIDHGIAEGWIVPITPPGRRRPMYRLQHVQQYIKTQLTREGGDSGDD